MFAKKRLFPENTIFAITKKEEICDENLEKLRKNLRDNYIFRLNANPERKISQDCKQSCKDIPGS
jgi:hypothetical protein